MTTATPRTPFTRDDISIATRAADSFTRIYYNTYDSSTRVADLPSFYRSSSSLSWNGTTKQGIDGLKELITKMPPTKHEMQSFDCHPIPGTSPPSLLITVSGNVIHGRGPAGNPHTTGARTIDGHSRVFSQTFMLVPDATAASTKAGEVGKYYISADALRFVG
ncbi:hypothetical protein DFS33DRAFT_1380138 [Desarmillaria ectypa]|nr:hypothetical protein DFS33DRAFT_1380138 [Desarmillaria ectypa]